MSVSYSRFSKVSKCQLWGPYLKSSIFSTFQEPNFLYLIGFVFHSFVVLVITSKSHFIETSFIDVVFLIQFLDDRYTSEKMWTFLKRLCLPTVLPFVLLDNYIFIDGWITIILNFDYQLWHQQRSFVCNIAQIMCISKSSSFAF